MRDQTVTKIAALTVTINGLIAAAKALSNQMVELITTTMVAKKN